MNIVFLTPGTGHTYCENCLHDSMLARELIRQSHDVRMYPLYLPLVTDTPDPTADKPVSLGGVNMYLRDQLPLWRKLPDWMTRALDNRSVLEKASRRMGMTSPADLGKATVAMLSRSTQPPQSDLQQLIESIRSEGRPDVIVLSNIMLVGMARHLADALDCTIACQLQGEDQFLDALPEPWSEDAWSLIRNQLDAVGHLISPSRSYASTLARRLSIPIWRISVVPSAIDLDGYPDSASVPDIPTICFMSRIAPEKGIEPLIRAFAGLHQTMPDPIRLVIAGTLAAHEQGFLKQMQELAAESGIQQSIRFETDVSRSRKIEILSGSTVLSVPLLYEDAFGLFIPEAWAAGTPVVMPATGASVELIEDSGAGTLYSDQDQLAETLSRYLSSPGRALDEGNKGIALARSRFSVADGATRFREALLN